MSRPNHGCLPPSAGQGVCSRCPAPRVRQSVNKMRGSFSGGPWHQPFLGLTNGRIEPHRPWLRNTLSSRSAKLLPGPYEVGTKASRHTDGQQDSLTRYGQHLDHDRRGPPRRNCRSSEQCSGEGQSCSSGNSDRNRLATRGGYTYGVGEAGNEGSDDAFPLFCAQPRPPASPLRPASAPRSPPSNDTQLATMDARPQMKGRLS